MHVYNSSDGGDMMILLFASYSVPQIAFFMHSPH